MNQSFKSSTATGPIKSSSLAASQMGDKELVNLRNFGPSQSPGLNNRPLRHYNNSSKQYLEKRDEVANDAQKCYESQIPV